MLVQVVRDLTCKRLLSRGWQCLHAIRCHLRFFTQLACMPSQLQAMHSSVTRLATGAYGPDVRAQFAIAIS